MTTEHDLDDFYPDADLMAKLASHRQLRNARDMGVKIEPDYNDYRRMTPEERQAYEDRPVHASVEDDEFEFAFAAQCSLVADEWGHKRDITDMERAEGAVRGVLSVMNGNLGTVFPQVMLFTCKHGNNNCNVFRDGQVINSVTDRTTHFYGGPLLEFDRLRRQAAEFQVKEDSDE